MTPAQYVQNKAAASGSSFYYAFRFLAPPRRAAITAFYAFCREVDDVVDEMRDPGVAATKLQWWRHEVASAFDGRASHPVTQALMPHTAAFDIQAGHLLAVIDGCQMDLEQTRFLDFAGLQRYCHLVAGVVGEVASNIFGRTQAQTLQYAHTLGLAMQLTNISRDVGEDARAGRVFLPLDWLREEGVEVERFLAAPAATPGVRRVTARLLAEADRLYLRAESGVAALPLACRPGIFAARHIYAGIGGHVARAEYDSVTRRARTGRGQKLGWLMLAGLRAVASPVLPQAAVLHARPAAEVAFLVEAAARTDAARGRSEALFEVLSQLEARARGMA